MCLSDKSLFYHCYRFKKKKKAFHEYLAEVPISARVFFFFKQAVAVFIGHAVSRGNVQDKCFSSPPKGPILILKVCCFKSKSLHNYLRPSVFFINFLWPTCACIETTVFEYSTFQFSKEILMYYFSHML